MASLVLGVGLGLHYGIKAARKSVQKKQQRQRTQPHSQQGVGALKSTRKQPALRLASGVMCAAADEEPGTMRPLDMSRSLQN